MKKTNLLDRAHEYASKKHEGQLDDSGKPYFLTHIIQVVSLVTLVTKDENIIAAAYLHDVVEDCGVMPHELAIEFGFEITELVMEVTHDGDQDAYGRYFPRLNTQSGIVIKFADRLSNISRMESWDDKRQKHYLKKSKFWKTDIDNETLELEKKLKSIKKVKKEHNVQ